MADLIGSLVIFVGAVFLFSAGLGMFRMPDAFTRIQAGTKASTLGTTLVLAGIAIHQPGWTLKALVIVYFVLMTNPVSSHALARAASSMLDRGAGASDRGSSEAEPAAAPGGAWSGAVLLLIALIGVIFASVLHGYEERSSLPELAQAYTRLVPTELGVPNVITGILLTYRSFDTLGEVAVLFMVAAGMGLLLGTKAPPASAPVAEASPPTPPTEIVRNGADILVPLIAIFAAYIVMHGHLGPGGGFQGGAVMASCVLLLVLAYPEFRVKLARLSAIESVAGLLIVLIGVAGIALAGGFLDNRILPLGEFGALFSAGAIPLLSVLLGTKVGCELSVIIERFRA